MKRLSTILLLAIFCLSINAKRYTVDNVPNVQLSDSRRYLSNPDGIVSSGVAMTIDSLLADIRRTTKAEVVAVVLDDIELDDIDEFGTQLFNKWGVGRRSTSNGVMLLVVRERHDLIIRTGYGAEGILTDALASRIIRNSIIPHFREEDYDAGMLSGVRAIHAVMTSPEAAEELLSELEEHGDADDDDFALAVFGLVLIGGTVLTLLIIYIMYRYRRTKARICPHCKSKMKRLDEKQDNAHLSASQDMEERLRSVDYDVWVCPTCKYEQIEKYVSSLSNYKECPCCHSRTMKQTSSLVLRRATTLHSGTLETTFVCEFCHKTTKVRTTIPRQTVYVSGGGSHGGGGGFGGGGFGGGMTGGGGARGHW